MKTSKDWDPKFIAHLHAEGIGAKVHRLLGRVGTHDADPMHTPSQFTAEEMATLKALAQLSPAHLKQLLEMGSLSPPAPTKDEAPAGTGFTEEEAGALKAMAARAVATTDSDTYSYDAHVERVREASMAMGLRTPANANPRTLDERIYEFQRRQRDEPPEAA